MYLNLVTLRNSKEGMVFLDESPKLLMQSESKKRKEVASRTCEFCGLPLSISPEMRKGPSGRNTLCNKVSEIAISPTTCLTHIIHRIVWLEVCKARMWTRRCKKSYDVAADSELTSREAQVLLFVSITRVLVKINFKTRYND